MESSFLVHGKADIKSSDHGEAQLRLSQKRISNICFLIRPQLCFSQADSMVRSSDSDMDAKILISLEQE